MVFLLFHRIYVGAPRALLARQRSSNSSLNSTETIPNGRLFGNIFECPNGTNECYPILIESKKSISYFSWYSFFLLIGKLFEAMPSFINVLDDAWLGSSLIATSDDSLVVRN